MYFDPKSVSRLPNKTHPQSKKIVCVATRRNKTNLGEQHCALGGDQSPRQVAVPEQRHEPHAGGAMARQGMVVAFDLGVLIPLGVKIEGETGKL